MSLLDSRLSLTFVASSATIPIAPNPELPPVDEKRKDSIVGVSDHHEQRKDLSHLKDNVTGECVHLTMSVIS
jgi:hypothetical protein